MFSRAIATTRNIMFSRAIATTRNIMFSRAKGNDRFLTKKMKLECEKP